MINFKVEILEEYGGTRSWREYPTAVFPFTDAQLLDERLDECRLTLKYVATAYFKPLTLVKVTITNTPEALFSQAECSVMDSQKETSVSMTYDYATKRITESRTIIMCVANDNSIKVMGMSKSSEVYNHDIYLIEPTKILEGYIGESLTFTNALGNDYGV